MKLSELAQHLGGQVVGDDVEITRLAPITEAQAGDLTFLANPKYTARIATTKASAIILPEDFSPVPLPSLRVADPYFAFAKALEILHPPEPPPRGIHPTAVVGKKCHIGSNVSIGAYTVIDDLCHLADGVTIYPHCTLYRGVVIGENSTVHANSTIREFTVVGKRVTIHSGARIGVDGFGYAKDPTGHWYKIIQPGRVIIEDDVEIGANTTIDRPAVGETRIRRNTKIDNLVQIGHGSTIGENCLLCAQVGLAGSSQLGRNVILAGQVGVAGHLTIGDNVIATAQTGIPSSVEPNTVVSGYPALPNKEWLKASALFRRLPQFQKILREIDERLKNVECIVCQGNKITTSSST